MSPEMSDFWSMGGYAAYVWGSYAAAVAVFIWNMLVPRLGRRDVLRRLRDTSSGPEETP